MLQNTCKGEITDAQGAYAFVGLSPGDYIVREKVPANYEQTYPNVSGARLFATRAAAATADAA